MTPPPPTLILFVGFFCRDTKWIVLIGQANVQFKWIQNSGGHNLVKSLLLRRKSPGLHSAACWTEGGIWIIQLEDENKLQTKVGLCFGYSIRCWSKPSVVSPPSGNQQTVSGFPKGPSPGAAERCGGRGLRKIGISWTNCRSFSACNPNLSLRFWVSSGFLKPS